MAKVTPITEQFQHFVSELKESFWGDLQGQVQQSMRRLFELLSERQRDLYMVSPRHSRQKPRQDYRNGYYERDFVTRFGTLRLRIARTRKRGFLPEVLQKFQRRAEEVSLLIREAFLRGISHPAGGAAGGHPDGRTGQPANRLALDPRSGRGGAAVSSGAAGRTNGPTCFWTGSACACAGPAGRQRVHMLVAYGVRAGRHPATAGLSAQQGRKPERLGGAAPGSVPPRLAGREPAADRHRWLSRDWRRRSRPSIPGRSISAAGCTRCAISWRRCAAATMTRSKPMRRRFIAPTAARQAAAAFRAFRRRWQSVYGSMVRQLERDLPQLLSFFSFPRHLWRKLRTTNIIERCFVEVRRRTRPMVCFVNVKSVDRIIYSIFQRFNLEWKTRTLRVFTQAA